MARVFFVQYTRSRERRKRRVRARDENGRKSIILPLLMWFGPSALQRASAAVACPSNPQSKASLFLAVAVSSGDDLTGDEQVASNILFPFLLCISPLCSVARSDRSTAASAFDRMRSLAAQRSLTISTRAAAHVSSSAAHVRMGDRSKSLLWSARKSRLARHSRRTQRAPCAPRAKCCSRYSRSRLTAGVGGALGVVWPVAVGLGRGGDGVGRDLEESK